MAAVSEGLLRDDSFSGLMNLIPSRMHYAEEDDGQSKKKTKKAKIKQTKQTNDVSDKTDKEGNKRKLADRDSEKGEKAVAPAPKKKKAKTGSPPDEVEAAEQLIEEAADDVGRPSEKPAQQGGDTKKAAEAGTSKSAKKNKKGKKEAAVEAPEPAPTPKDEAINGSAKPKAAVDTTSKTTTKPAPIVEPTKASAKPTATVDTSSTKNSTKPAPTADLLSDVSVTSSEPQSSTFDESTQKPANGEAASSTTSVSSVTLPADKPKHIKIPEDTAAFRERFAERLAALRAARKADGSDGKPARTRQELLEQRREKQAQRKEHKKEMRRVAKLEEEARREEALKANSPSVMSPNEELDEHTANFSFGRVSFGDGAQLSHDLSYVLSRDGKKGASDPKTALLKLQNQKKRLAAMDAEKRKDVEEKEAWLTARRRAEGEKIRDDEAVLKKTIKRKERGKKKSEKEWKDRKSAVEQGIKARQKKRDENIRKRKEDKKSKGKKKGKKKARPGFEGRFGGKK